MAMKKIALLGLIFPATLGFLTSAQAAPVTLYFTYDATESTDLTTNTVTDAGIYSGWISWDTSLAEYSQDVYNYGGLRRDIRYQSDSNCFQVDNGVCSADGGSPGSMFITGFSVDSPFGTLTLANMPSSVGQLDTLAGIQERYIPGYYFDNWGVSAEGRFYRSYDSSVEDPDAPYVYEAYQRQYSAAVGLFSYSTDMFAAFPNISEGINFSGPQYSPFQVYLYDFEYIANCGAQSCSVNGYSPGSFGVRGSLVTARLETTSVPEPTTLSLLGIALAGLGVARRRKPRAIQPRE